MRTYKAKGTVVEANAKGGGVILLEDGQRVGFGNNTFGDYVKPKLNETYNFFVSVGIGTTLYINVGDQNAD